MNHDKKRSSIGRKFNTIFLITLLLFFSALVPYTTAASMEKSTATNASATADLQSGRAVAATTAEISQTAASIAQSGKASLSESVKESSKSKDSSSESAKESSKSKDSSSESAKESSKSKEATSESSKESSKNKDSSSESAKESSKSKEATSESTKESSKSEEATSESSRETSQSEEPASESSKETSKDSASESSRETSPSKDSASESTKESQEETQSSADPLTISVSSAIKDTRTYILSVDSKPDWNSQWFVLGNARNGMASSNKYIKTFYQNAASYISDKEGNLSASQYSEYSKAILSLTSIGYDARDINGYNLLSYLADFSKVKKQGFNGPVWALMALNCHPSYEIPVISGVDQQTTEAVLIEYILGREISGGGWAFSGSTPDVDMTAITIQALAPYYKKSGYSNVTAAINRALDVLSQMQSSSTGGFQSMQKDNSESCSQVIVALCALGIDCKKDSRFIKNGKWPVEALLSYKINGSGFRHIADGSVNSLATAQGFYALVAYQRLQNGKTFLYNMSDVTLTAGPDPTENAGKETTKAPKPEKETTKAAAKETTKASAKETTKASVKETTKAPGKKNSKGGGSISLVTGTTAATTTGAGTTGAGTTSAAASSEDSSSTGQDGESSSEDILAEVEDESESISEEEGGWSFTGDTYVPEASAEEYVDDENQLAAADTGITADSASNPSPLTRILLGLFGVLTGTSIAYLSYRYIMKHRKED